MRQAKVNLNKVVIAIVNLNNISWQRKKEIDESYHEFMLEAREQDSIEPIENFIALYNNCQINPKQSTIAICHADYFVTYEFVKLKKQITTTLKNINKMSINVRQDEKHNDEYLAMLELHPYLLRMGYTVDVDFSGDYTIYNITNHDFIKGL